MTTSLRLKTALLAAASLTAASIAVAQASDAAPIEPVAIEHAVHVADHEADRAGPDVTAKKLGIAALGAAAIAGFARLIGWRRVKAAAAATTRFAGEAASAGVAATAAAARAVGRAVGSPIRFALFFASLGLFALTGVGLYDVEWMGGIVVGAIGAASLLIGAREARKAFAFKRKSARVN